MKSAMEQVRGLATEEQRRAASVLEEAGQSHLFEAWNDPQVTVERKLLMLDQVSFLDQQYPGGLLQYVKNSKSLLENSKKGVNPFEGCTPCVPQGERLQVGTTAFDDAERLAMEEAIPYTGFVLVAGGLGERLGYKGIKIALPCEIVTGKSFMQLYAEYILAFQERARASTGNSSLVLPLAIMTSGDTHDATVAFLEKNSNFGLEKVDIVKQEKVPALIDNDARFAVKESDPLEIATKPHGHGDVHTLLYQHGVVRQWRKQGTRWIVFFQDTNAVVFRSLPAALGVSIKNSFEVNSLTVPRRPGEAVGAICKLVSESKPSLTVNVEYNQLDPLLRATSSPQGDIADASGFSPYPGNINVLIFAAEPYERVLEETKGAVPEFVNPKYADASKTVFKKPTRLECMMQDYPRLLKESAKVGFTQLERWICFSAVKNNLEDAKVKAQSTGFPESASSGEHDLYELNRRLLALGKDVSMEIAEEKAYKGIPVIPGPRVVLSPSFGVTQAEVAEKLAESKIHLSARSTLVLNGSAILIRSLDLDGALYVEAAGASPVVIDNCTMRNNGCVFQELEEGNDSPQELTIRGYTMQKGDAKVIKQ